MANLTEGPSDNAWGIKLCDPILVSHEGRQVLCAREEDAAMQVLYFRVLDPNATTNTAASAGWNGWYRIWLPQADNRPPHNAEAAAEGRPNELRIAGMDLLTIPPLEETVTSPANAPFRAISQGTHLLLFRPSTHGTIYMDRMILVATAAKDGRQTVERYRMEVAWEVRFKRSGLRDIPLNDTDGPGYRDAAGQPFPAPTVEFRNLGALTGGLFDVVAVPTANDEVSQLYFLAAETQGFQLTRVQVGNYGAPDYATSQFAYRALQPSLKTPAAPLTPIAGLAPALTFYGEQETSASSDGEDAANVPRAARLVCALPVSGGGLNAAMAVLDYTLNVDGHVADLPAADQTLPLVDGTIQQGSFAPDTTAPVFPTPANIAETLKIVDSLAISGLILGQIEPHATPFLRAGEDGLLHLYFGGPLPSTADARFDNLVPDLPQAMVAQCDVRVTRVALGLPWTVRGRPKETGEAVFRARLPGSVMDGTSVTISDASFPGQPEPHLCDIAISYPATTGFPSERWAGVPRDLTALMDIVNGKATDDSSDPAVLAGERSYFDFAGTHPMVRVPLTTAPPTGTFPVMSFVSTRSDLAISTVTASAGSVQLVFSDGTGTVTVTWPGLPATLGAARDIFDGSADPATYAYPATASDTVLYALNTDAPGVDAPLVLYQTDAQKPDYELLVTADTAHAGKLKLTVKGPAAGDQVFDDLPPNAQGFAQALPQAQGFSTLGLKISAGGTAGDVAVTAAAERPLGLAEKTVLFDVLATPGANLDTLGFTAATYHAITQRHDLTGADITAAVAVYVTSLRPESGLAAELGNGSGTALPAPVKDAGWVRQIAPKACTFDTSDAVSVSVNDQYGTRLPQSLNLRPQRTWSLESWIKPDRADYQRLLSFDDGPEALSPTEPVPRYALSTEGQEVITFATFTPPAAGICSFFLTNVNPYTPVMPKGAFTVECWVQPDTDAALPPAGSNAHYGGIFQAGDPRRNPFLSLTLSRDRIVVLQTTDTSSTVHIHASGTRLPAVGASQERLWSHLALIGRQDGANDSWSLDLLVDGQKVYALQDIDLQDQPNAQIVIGRNYATDTSLFGSVAQLRYWNVARSASDIRRTWRTTLSGYEPGLLGDWPMSGYLANSKGQKYLLNNATEGGTNWDAFLSENTQPVTTPRDSFFLSLIAEVGGLASIEADARLATGAWNHIALTYEAGGALALNPTDRYQNGVYDWAECPDSSALGTAPHFAIDAWVIIAPGLQGEVGTIMAQWAPEDLEEDQAYRLWVDSAGELNFKVYVASDYEGAIEPVSVCSSGWALNDNSPHHIAVTVATSNANPDASPKIDAKVTLSLYKDGGPPVVETKALTDVESAELRASSMTVTVGRSYAPLKGDAPQAAEDFAPFRGTIGRLRYWADMPNIKQVFSEHERHLPDYGPPKGLAAQWDFREGAGRVCADSIGGNELLLNTSQPWALMSETSTMTVYANGNLVGVSEPYTTARPAVSAGQFTLGLPDGWTGASANLGFQGEVSRLSLYEGARSLDEVRAQRFMPRAGNEPRLLACWSFSDGTDDITGGGNNISPAPAPARIVDSNVPISNEDPVVRNVYGGPVTRFSGSTPGRIAVGSYAVARFVGSDDQHAALLREYVLDPADALSGGIQVGVMNLIYLGQVQTDATLIGFIEGAPPVPSENLTRPYYLNPGSPGYMAYLDTSSVTLEQQAGTAMSFSSSSSQSLKVASDFAIGLIKTESHVAIITGSPVVSSATNVMDHAVNLQATFTVDGSWGSGSSEELSAAWTAAQSNYMGFSGGWEGFQSDPNDYFNPEVGRRFMPDNLGYALIESLTADQYAMTVGTSNTATGVIVVPNPAIPPDRNIILFPMDNSYTLAGSLDGKIGLRNAPGYRDADIRRGSYFKPVEAYARARRIETRRAGALAYFEQRDVAARAHGWDKEVSDATPVLPASFEDEPEGPVAVATPTQGLVNRYAWTADGGLYSETHATKASYTTSFTGTREEGGGGGFHIDGEHTFAKVGLAWSLDLMITKRIDLTTQKSLTEEQEMSMDVAVAGEAFLSKYDPNAPSEYGATGNFLPGAAPGKVKAYRFMTLYDPPSMDNSNAFKSIIDPAWLDQSNSPMARALRTANLSNPAWRVMHRVTYVERVPPPIASRPLYTPDKALRVPDNLPGNAELIALVLAQVPANASLSPDAVTDAVSKAINPAPTGPGVYPPSALERQLAWWGAFLTSARPDSNNDIPDPEAAVALRDTTAHVNDYILAGVATGAIAAH